MAETDMDRQRKERISKFLAEHQRQRLFMLDVDFLLLFENYLGECESRRMRD